MALNFFKEAHTLFEQLGCNLSMADNLMCQFNIYYRQKEFEQAIQCLKQAIALATDCGWEHKIALCYGNLSTVYLQLEKHDEAANASEKDIQISTKLKNKQNVGVAYFRLGRIEAAKGNTSKAIELLKDSCDVCGEPCILVVQVDAGDEQRCLWACRDHPSVAFHRIHP